MAATLAEHCSLVTVLRQKVHAQEIGRRNISSPEQVEQKNPYAQRKGLNSESNRHFCSSYLRGLAKVEKYQPLRSPFWE